MNQKIWFIFKRQSVFAFFFEGGGVEICHFISHLPEIFKSYKVNSRFILGKFSSAI